VAQDNFAAGESLPAIMQAYRWRDPKTNIGWAYRMAGLVDPTAVALVRLEHKAARKVLGTRQRQARGIRYKGDVTDLDAPASGVSLAILLQATRRDLIGPRDRALLLVAYDTGGRRSELVAVRVEQIDGPDGDGVGHIAIDRSKTNQGGQGDLAYLSPQAKSALGAGRTRTAVPARRDLVRWFDPRRGRGRAQPGRGDADLQTACEAGVWP
jgi:integrase